MAHQQHGWRVRNHPDCGGGPDSLHAREGLDSPAHQHGVPDIHGVRVRGAGEVSEGVREELVPDQSVGEVPLQGRGVSTTNLGCAVIEENNECSSVSAHNKFSDGWMEWKGLRDYCLQVINFLCSFSIKLTYFLTC